MTSLEPLNVVPSFSMSIKPDESINGSTEASPPSFYAVSPISDTSEPTSRHLLPPCRICGNKASGLHYGVNTCEACKGFFRRSLFNKDKYVCNKSSRCDIKSGKRSHCAYCRYHKCLKLGMSVHAIRTGRYTHQKKAHDTIEVKQLQQNQKSQEQITQYNNFVNAIMEGIVNTDIVKTLSGTRSEHKLCRKTLEIEKEATSVFGLHSLTHEQHQSFFKSTGIDLDGRKEAIEKWSYGSRCRLTLIVSLASAIPGFKTLPIKDRINLIKASRCEAITVMIHQHFDYDKRVFYSVHTGEVCSEIEFIKIYDDKDMVDKMFSTCRNLQVLKLEVSELLLVLGIIMLFPDRVELEEKQKVEDIQWTLTECLSHLLKVNHPEQPNLFSKVLAFLVRIRDLTVLADRALPKIQKDWAPACEIDPFWGEFIADSQNWSDKHI